MNFAELLSIARTCRRWQAESGLEADALKQLAGLTRYCASASNRQALRYISISSKAAKEKIFSLITLGGAFSPEQRTRPSQQPGAYIIILGPEKMSDFGIMDVGIAAQSINLAAADMGLACCMVGAFNAVALKDFLPEDLRGELVPRLVLALGISAEDRRVVALPADGNCTYYRDENDVHCVPKREVADLVLGDL